MKSGVVALSIYDQHAQVFIVVGFQISVIDAKQMVYRYISNFPEEDSARLRLVNLGVMFKPFRLIAFIPYRR